MAVRTFRTKKSIAQDTLAHLAGIDRSHLGKIERGTHMPTLAIILRVAAALDTSATLLMAETEANLAQIHNASSNKD